MLKIGITGGIGSGKSVVSKILESMGYPVFNSDLEAKNIIDNNVEVRSELIALLGTEIYGEAGLDRELLAQQLFSDTSIREAVNEIVHPRVREAFNQHCESNSIVFNEAAILIETGAHKKFDKILLISAAQEDRIARVMKRDGVSREQVLSRINNQWDDDKKRAYSDFEIKNDDSEPLLIQVEEMINQVTSV
ncbi:MAG: dephospho-CoA kinase [Crocinitomicaceae bacterium]|nr:dephospho-CoA kinase [Crocinitomicaceae bacterium]